MSAPAAAQVPDLSLASVPASWPIAMAAALMEEGSALYAKNLKFVEEEIRIHEHACPVYLLAGADDDITTPEQVLNAARHVGTAPERILSKTVPGGRIGLFMGARTLGEHWPEVARWIVAQSA
jgi:poly(3-hydroxyalkanoate) synthetase